MTIRVTDTIVRSPRGTAAQAIAWAERNGAQQMPHVRTLIETLYALGAKYGIDASILCAQAAHETDRFKSALWVEFLNPAGLGAFDDGTYTGGSFSGGTTAAYGQFAHMAAYVGVDVPVSISRYDPRFSAVFVAGFAGSVTRLEDLGSGRWATDPNYAPKLAALGSAIYPTFESAGKENAVSALKPSVPQPIIYNLANDYARFGLSAAQANEVITSRFHNRNGGRPRRVLLHIQDGSTRGSLGWWASPDVQASSTVMIQKDGSILQVVPEQHGPWTNGDVRYPTAAGARLVAMGGNANNWSLTIEAEGGPWDAMPTAQLNAIIWQVQDWYSRYPEIAADGLDGLLRHADVNTIDKINCGIYRPAVAAVIGPWLNQPAPQPEPEPVSIYPPGMTLELARRLYGTVTVPWSSKTFGFDPERTECQAWLISNAAGLKDGESYTAAKWPRLEDIIRRGATKNIHAYQYSDGSVYEKVIRPE